MSDNKDTRHGPRPLARARPPAVANANGPARVAGTSKPLGKSARVVELLRSVEIIKSPTGRTFAVVDGRAIACDSRDFVGWCASEFLRRNGHTISASMIKDAELACSHDAPTQPVFVRVGGDVSRIVVDLGGETVAVTSKGLKQNPGDCRFLRAPGAHPLPQPVWPSDGPQAARALVDIRTVLGVDAPTWTVCVAWLLAALRPVGPYPILYVRGEENSGKSTLARLLRMLIDPHRPELVKCPRDPRDLAILAERSHVLALDNLSAIDSEISDALCRVATGDGFVTRALYSDRDLTTFDMARPIMMTSIVDAATRPDLLDRALFIDLPARTARTDDDALRADVERLRPAVLGALLFGCAQALAAPYEGTMPPEVRMLGPARFAFAAAPAIGLDQGEMRDAYVRARAAKLSILGEDPLIEALNVWMPKPSEWKGTAATLLATLNRQRDGRPPRGWPESPRGLVAALRRLAPTLRTMGITHTSEGREGHDNARVQRFVRV